MEGAGSQAVRSCPFPPFHLLNGLHANIEKKRSREATALDLGPGKFSRHAVDDLFTAQHTSHGGSLGTSQHGGAKGPHPSMFHTGSGARASVPGGGIAKVRLDLLRVLGDLPPAPPNRVARRVGHVSALSGSLNNSEAVWGDLGHTAYVRKLTTAKSRSVPTFCTPGDLEQLTKPMSRRGRIARLASVAC